MFLMIFAVPEITSKKEEKVDESVFLQALEGFLLVVSADGDLVYLSENINEYLGITQVCIRLFWHSKITDIMSFKFCHFSQLRI